MQIQGLGYSRIAKRLNEEGIKTLRGKEFVGARVHSILKKKRLQEERINQKSKKKISAFRFQYFPEHAP
jgi:hypothetical protein